MTDDRGRKRDGSPRSPASLSPGAAFGLAILFGLACGYLDVAIIVWKKHFWDELGVFWSGSDFPWSVPLGHVALLMVPALILAVSARVRPKPISFQAGTTFFATLAIWSALLRMPLYGVASLLLAAGLGRLIGGIGAAFLQRPRHRAYAVSALLMMLIILAAVSTGRQVWRRWQAEARQPPPPANARNVLMIVWDTVRAGNLGLYGYPRSTTPHLAQWARRGVRYERALAPAPWTFPSHSCFLTGEWPFRINTQWKFRLDDQIPTLAEYLAAHGYQTAGFSANTVYCSYETGLDRGFGHFEDYPLNWESWLGRTVAGSWLLRNVVHRGDAYATKWIRFQSRDAAGIRQAFLDWLRHRPKDRPFFAFLNDFDAHEPYIPPAGYAGRFGIRPQDARDYQFLLDYYQPGRKAFQVRDIWMARDCYDACIAYLDDQLGRLLGALQVQGLLENTLVIITSDHGESFGDHGFFLHPASVYLDELAVPLVILSPDAPPGRVVSDPVSLRDLPATVVDRLGLAAGSPFPGTSLAARWSSSTAAAPGQAPMPLSPALSEYATPSAVQSHDQHGRERRGLQMSLVASGRHYVRDGEGTEQLYDLGRDPVESLNLMTTPEGKHLAGFYRRKLLEILTDNPGSTEVERAYLTAYKQWLESVVEKEGAPAGEAISAREGRSRDPSGSSKKGL